MKSLFHQPGVKEVQGSVHTIRTNGILVNIQRFDVQGLSRPIIDQNLGGRMYNAEESSPVLVVSGIFGLCWDP